MGENHTIVSDDEFWVNHYAEQEKAIEELEEIVSKFEAGAGSRDIVLALRNLQTSTMNGGYNTTLNKAKLFLELKDELGKSEIVRSNVGIYMASGVDVELPLLMGLRSFVMIDDQYDGKFLSENLDGGLSLYDGFEVNGPMRSFLFDFGQGPEKVYLTTVSAIDLEYVPEFRSSMYLQVLGPNKDMFHSDWVVNNLLVGGFVFDEGSLGYYDLGSTEHMTEEERMAVVAENHKKQEQRFGLLKVAGNSTVTVYKKLFENSETRLAVQEASQRYRLGLENMSF